jgi:hypothetical protein
VARSPLAPLAALTVGLSLVAPSLAQSPADLATAESLFKEGRRLMDAQKYAEGCPKLAASLSLDPQAGGTALWLALCHELEGKTATAWAEFGNAEAMAKRDQRPERETAAREHAKALEGKLARLSISLGPAAGAIAGLAVTRDGAPVIRESFGVAVAVDPGKHVVKVTAPGRQPWTKEIDVRAASQEAVIVPDLAVARDEPTTAPPPPPPPTKGPPPDEPQPAGGHRTTGFIVGGVGVAALAVGGVFGLSALSKHSDAKSACPGGVCASSADADTQSSARSAARIADIGFVLGAIGVGVGAYLVLTDPGPSKTSGYIAPQVGPGTAGAAVGGTF